MIPIVRKSPLADLDGPVVLAEHSQCSGQIDAGQLELWVVPPGCLLDSEDLLLELERRLDLPELPKDARQIPLGLR